jgi:hypothetical protein
MRVLFLIAATNSDRLKTCSSAIRSHILTKQFLRRYDNAILYWVVPNNVLSLSDDYPAMYKDEPRVKFIGCETGETPDEEHFFIDEKVVQMFDAQRGQHYYDILVCDKPAILPQFLRGMEVNEFDTVLSFCNVTFLMDSTAKHYISRLKETVFMAGSSACTSVLVMAQKHFQEMIARAYVDLSTELYDNLRNKPLFNSAFIDLEAIDAIPKFSRSSKFTVHMAVPFHSLYGGDVVVEAVEEIWKSGRNIRLLMTSPAKGGGYLAGKYSIVSKDFIEPHYDCARLRFFTYCREGDCFIYHLWRKNFYGISYVEQRLLGEIAIVDTVTQPLDISDDYPLKFSTKDELIGILKYLQRIKGTKEFEELSERNVREAREFLENHIDHNAFFEFVDSHMRNLSESVPMAGIGELIQDFAKGRKEFSFNTLFKHMADKGRSSTMKNLRTITSRRIWRHMGTSRFRIRQMVLAQGFRDVGDPDNVRFERITDG